MSKKIKITIVAKNEKLNNTVDGLEGQSVIVTHDSSMTMMSTLLKNDLISGSFCGGRGDCGRCRIQFVEGATTPTALERSVMEPEELRQGYRLACLAKPKDDCVIKLALLDAPEITVVSNVIEVTEKIDCISQQNLQTQNHKPSVMESVQAAYGNANKPPVISNRQDISRQEDRSRQDALIAVDLGTTTIAMQLMSMDTGQIIDTYCEMNPQRRYGADVLSRIQASCEGNRDRLQALVVEALERGVKRFKKHDIPIRCMCIAGNTTMEHLLMGYDVSSLGSSPFTPVECGLQELSNPAWNFKVWLVPCISAFVGGDIVAGLYVCGLLPNTGNMEKESVRHLTEQRKYDENRAIALLIDLGTNGEMAITDGTRMIVTATAAGPAFEGGAGAGIVGSDMIACVAELLRQGILDETGLLAEPYFTEGVSIQSADLAKDRQNVTPYHFTPGRSEASLYLTQEDIRSLQMAKAAVRAGVEILLNRLKKQKTDERQGNNSQVSETRSCEGQKCQTVRVYLAGGFGYYLDVEAAFRIGLLPEDMRGSVQAVGNTSLAGAYRIGRDLWQHGIDKQTLEKSLSSIESINLAEQEEFEWLYIQYMNFLTC